MPPHAEAEEPRAVPAGHPMSIRSRLFGLTAVAVDPRPAAAAPASSWLVRGYLVVLGMLLLGYMFMGRGFAHIGVGPVFIGDVVMVVGVLVGCFAMAWWRVRPRPTWTVALLVAFAILGAARTLPYVGTYGIEALRDGVLWGYAAFALIVYVLVDRLSLLASFRTYGWIVPLFALWLPIGWNLFRMFSVDIDPNRPGGVVPLVFFKAGDMAVHVVGAVAFLVLGAAVVTSLRAFVWRAAIFVPLLWTIFVAATANRGSLVTSVLGIAAVVVLAPRSRNWLPLLGAVVVLVAGMAAQTAIAPVMERALSDLPLFDSPPAPSASASPAPSSTAKPSTPPPQPAREAQINGDFESTTDQGAVGWRARGGEMTIEPHGGQETPSFASVSNPLGPYETTLMSRRFEVAAPEFQVSASAKAMEGSPTAEIYAQWYDNRGDLLASTFVLSLSTAGERAWTGAVGRVAVVDGARYADLVIYEATGHATMGIDDITVTTGDLAVQVQARGTSVQNGGFEVTSAGPSMVEGWITAGGRASIVIGDAHGGERSISLQNPNGPYFTTLTSSPFHITGPDMRATAWTRALAGEPRLEMYVNSYDADGEFIASRIANSIEPSDEWQRLSAVVSWPENAASAELLFYEGSGDATVGIDDVSVRMGDFAPEAPPAADPGGRPATIAQLIENIASVFGSADDGGLEGTKQFRLAWWGTIIDYTVFGEHFWTGKGFGINLADDDGFQSTSDGSLRAPHNSHLTVLARMGVPGFALWALLQGAFGIGLLRATLRHRRTGSLPIAMTGAWVLAYWVAMMVDTSFDPYLEGPQGGIWFWAIIGLGLVVMRLERPASRL